MTYPSSKPGPHQSPEMSLALASSLLSLALASSLPSLALASSMLHLALAPSMLNLALAPSMLSPVPAPSMLSLTLPHSMLSLAVPHQRAGSLPLHPQQSPGGHPARCLAPWCPEVPGFPSSSGITFWESHAAARFNTYSMDLFLVPECKALISYFRGRDGKVLQ